MVLNFDIVEKIKELESAVAKQKEKIESYWEINSILVLGLDISDVDIATALEYLGELRTHRAMCAQLTELRNEARLRTTVYWDRLKTYASTIHASKGEKRKQPIDVSSDDESQPNTKRQRKE
jgi:hypothetical protein